ncbi:unnamed protein product [Protopolystoma xenopodis]|uniref:Uncharacterized protein n=1 Tax=Protopolystoma xenopodis TaxID=117903 RepID=A0A448XGY1_9PLAT|nr:unnamed protein product [Protopolystoma xenopodis]
MIQTFCVDSAVSADLLDCLIGGSLRALFNEPDGAQLCRVWGLSGHRNSVPLRTVCSCPDLGQSNCRYICPFALQPLFFLPPSPSAAAVRLFSSHQPAIGSIVYEVCLKASLASITLRGAERRQSLARTSEGGSRGVWPDDQRPICPCEDTDTHNLSSIEEVTSRDIVVTASGYRTVARFRLFRRLRHVDLIHAVSGIFDKGAMERKLVPDGTTGNRVCNRS